MNISNAVSALNFASIDGLRNERIYAWPNYRQASIERINPLEADVLQNSIQVLLPKNERDEIIRSFIEDKSNSSYTPNGKNFAANFAIVGSLFDAVV